MIMHDLCVCVYVRVFRYIIVFKFSTDLAPSALHTHFIFKPHFGPLCVCMPYSMYHLCVQLLYMYYVQYASCPYFLLFL